MSETSNPNPPAAADRQLAVAERWADWVRALAIYPETNVRVAAALDAFLASLEAALDACPQYADEGFPVLLTSKAAWAGDAEIGLEERPALRWLAERVSAAALAGVRFRAGVSRAVLLDFSRRLLDHHQRHHQRDDRRDRTFEEIWEEEYEGLALVDRRLEGAFLDDGAPSRQAVRTWSTGAGTPLAQRLAGDPAVRARLEALRARFRGGSAEEGTRQSVDLLGRIARLMPAEAMDGDTSAAEVAVRALEVLDASLDGEEGGPRLTTTFSDPALSTLLLVLSRRYFRRHVPPAAELEEPEAAWEAEEEGARFAVADEESVEEDVEAFLAEYAALPPLELPPADAREVDSRPEQIGVHLHYLVHVGSEETARRIQPVLLRLLRDGGEAEMRLLKPYLEAHAGGAERGLAGARYDRVVDLVRESGNAALARQYGVVTPRTVTKAFPRDFLLYLDALDLASPQETEELEHVCREVGPDRIRAAASLLVQGDGLLARGRPERILGTKAHGLLPLVRLILDQGGPGRRAGVIEYLRRLRPTIGEATLLWVVEDPGTLPMSYLLGLIDALARGTQSLTLRSQAASLLCAHLRTSSAGTPEEIARRVYAVKQLGGFDSREVRGLLQEIASASRFFFISREPKPVRQAAQEALRAMRQA